MEQNKTERPGPEWAELAKNIFYHPASGAVVSALRAGEVRIGTIGSRYDDDVCVSGDPLAVCAQISEATNAGHVKRRMMEVSGEMRMSIMAQQQQKAAPSLKERML